MPREHIKANVSAFRRDVLRDGSYGYTKERLSSVLAKKRITKALDALYPMSGRRLLDIGCGDGAYSVELVNLGAARLLGFDPSEPAVAAAAARAAQMDMADKARFEVGNIYTLSLPERFDCIILCGVLHHLPDAAEALKSVSPFADTVLIMEPNGLNPVVKILEKASRYHLEHEERSFWPSTIRRWLREAGFTKIRWEYANLVPMMCPDWMAKVCKTLEPFIEAIPLLRNIACGQYIILADKEKPG